MAPVLSRPAWPECSHENSGHQIGNAAFSRDAQAGDAAETRRRRARDQPERIRTVNGAKDRSGDAAEVGEHRAVSDLARLCTTVAVKMLPEARRATADVLF